MTVEPGRVSAWWLRTREAADAAARSAYLVEEVRRDLPAHGRTVVHDLGCGTGAMRRWLAPQLPGEQHWVMYDRDPRLLAAAAADPPVAARDGAVVTAETRQQDITWLTPDELGDASLITASALLDVLTADELERLVATCAGVLRPVLLAITVTGHVELAPPDPLDASVQEAFNDHQRRTAEGRRRLGPDAVAAAVASFTRRGADVLVRPSPWRLDGSQVPLLMEWLAGWVSAACEQRPDLGGVASGYLRGRLGEASSGRLTVTVHHEDLLARFPRQAGR